MMDVDLTLQHVFDRGTSLFPDREIVTCRPDVTRHRYTYSKMRDRATQLAGALDEFGLQSGDRVASLAMNHYRHLELYFGPACSGRTLHMVNVRLPDEHLIYLLNDAEDRVVFLDPQFLPKIESIRDKFNTVEQFVVLDDEVPDSKLDVIAYEDLISGQDTDYDWPELDQEDTCGICYTSGTTGKPKGVEYLHRAMVLHSMMVGHVDTMALGQNDTVMPVVPMFHANAWGIPYGATLAGSKQVLPGFRTDPEDIAKVIEEEQVTQSAAVPTVWIEMADYLEENPEVELSALEQLSVGGSAPPEALIRKYDEEFDIEFLQAWGMTETSPVATFSRPTSAMQDWSKDQTYEMRSKQGIPTPGIELRVRDEEGNRVPWDDDTFGEIEVRGPWVTDAYHKRPDANEGSFTEDGWLKTGDIATRDEQGFIRIVDRTKDVIKSGGEWISSVELENELMAQEDVTEAAVIGIPHEKWQERPLAYVVARADIEQEILRDHLLERFPEWWIPETFEFVDEIPRTSTGKFDKKELRKNHWNNEGGSE